MAKRYASFLIRWWCLSNGSQRIEIEHIQSGDRALLDSLRAAFDWIGARGDASARTSGSAPDHRDLTPRGNGNGRRSR